jgi:hypothetical protein
VRVRFPVCCPPFNPFYGYDLHTLSPYATQPFGLANLNQVQINVLFNNLGACLIRDLTDRGAAANNIGSGIAQVPVTVTLKENSTRLRVKYYRLQAFRAVPSTQSIATMKYMVSQSDSFPDGAVTGTSVGNHATIFESGKPSYIPASGRGHVAMASQLANIPLSVLPKTAFFEREITNINLPQLPQALFICFQKEVECFSHKRITEAASAGLRSVINQSSNAAIRKLYLQIQTSENVYTYSADKKALLDMAILYEDTIRNCCAGYFDFHQWRKNQCCLYLTSDTYCPLGLSPGTVAPVSLSIKCELENRNVSVGGLGPVVGTDGDAHSATPAELGLMADRIRGTLVCVAIYQRGVATISPSSCVLSTQAASVAQASEQLARSAS